MSPPFMSDYKKSFALKRICQSFLGGLRLFSPPVFIALQVGLFTLPALILSATCFLLIDSKSSLLWKSATIGLAICITDLGLSILIYGLKRGSRAHVGPGPGFRRTSLLGEEDQIEYIGILNFTTWNFVAPNVTAETTHIVAVLCSALAFTVCTPIVISSNQPVWLRSFGLFTLCNARYSSVLSLPPEISTFDAIHRRDLYYRPAYAIILGAASFITIWRTGEDAAIQFYFLLGLGLLPLFWGAGILAPMDAFVPWLIETALKLMGGCPSYYYFGSLLALTITASCSILVFVSAQHRIFSLLLQCAFGYLISIDLGAFLRLKSKYIFESAIHVHQIIVPVTTCLVSFGAVAGSILTECICWAHMEGIIIGICLSLALIASFSQRYTIQLNRQLPLSIYLPLSILEAIITTLLHTWLAAEAQEVERSESRLGTRALHHLLTYALTIRAFSVSIFEPRNSCWDMSITTALRWGSNDSIFRKLEFTTFLFIVSFLRKRIISFTRFIGMMGLIAHADAVTPLLENKLRIAACTLLALPVSMISLILASVAEGFTMNPIFSLPIFLVGFSRPSSFWKGSWLPTKKRFKTHDDRGLDYAIYSEIGPSLTRGFVRRAYASRMKLDRGTCYIARYEDRLLFLRVLAAGWNFVYLQIKGLEMQEKTSCHNQESAWLDELYDKEFGVRETLKKVSLSRTVKACLTIATPLFTLQVPTYSESKSTLSNLISREEKLSLERMFFKAFAFLWIKRSPVLQAESCLRKRNSVNSVAYSQLSSRDDDSASDSETLTSHGNETPTMPSITKSFFGSQQSNWPGSESRLYGTPPNPLGPGPSIWTSRAPMTPFPRIPGMQIPKSGPTRHPTLWPDSFTMENKNTIRNSEDFTHLNVLWIQKCLGESLPTREVRRKIEKLVAKIWKLVIGENNDYEEIDLYQFFTDNFLANQTNHLKKLDRGNIVEITMKAFRYAAKLCLDEIYNSTQSDEQSDAELSLTPLEETFIELNRLEREFQFCDQHELPKYIAQQQPHIVSMTKNEQGMTQLRIFNYEAKGVEFSVGTMYKEIIEGIWGNLNCELLYLTSDDDERFSIQHDRYLMRNIVTQCANSPLGYSVYDSTFRINIFKNFSIEQL